jgi:hypothetical protein
LELVVSADAADEEEAALDGLAVGALVPLLLDVGAGTGGGLQLP